jgi:hypothetical protein
MTAETGASKSESRPVEFDRPGSESRSKELDLQATIERIAADPGAKRYLPAALNAAAYATAWRRIARELPDQEHSEGFIGSGVERPGTFVHDGVSTRSLPFVSAVGLIDTARHDLRPFEGLKEGFASIGDR